MSTFSRHCGSRSRTPQVRWQAVVDPRGLEGKVPPEAGIDRVPAERPEWWKRTFFALGCAQIWRLEEKKPDPKRVWIRLSGILYYLWAEDGGYRIDPAK